MRYIYYIFLPIILLMSGCAGHSAIPGPEFDIQDGSYIFFDAEVIRTKGTLISGTTLPSDVENSRFGVFGTRPDGSHIFDMYAAAPNDRQMSSAFNNVAVMYRQEAGRVFHYDALALWMAGEHDFYAYYPYDNPKGAVISNLILTARPYLQYTQPVGLDDMVDVMTAAALNKKATDTDAQPVKFTFHHRLFAFDVILSNLQSESARNLRISHAEVKFLNVCSRANLYFDDGNDTDTYADVTLGTGKHDAITHTFALQDGFVLEAPAEEETSYDHNLNDSSSFLFLPCTELEVEFNMTFLNAWNEECEFELKRTITPVEAGGFQPGKRYALVVNMRDKGQIMEFQPEIKDWDSFDDIEIKFE
jgi:hypothetical protein